MSFESREDRPVSPIELFAFEAGAANLLGKGAGDTDVSGDHQRISHQEAEAIREELAAQVAPYVRYVQLPTALEGEEPITVPAAILPEEVSETIRNHIAESVAKLADGSLSGHELSKMSVVTHFFTSGWHREDGKYVSIEGDPLFKSTTEAASSLTYAVAMLEGNLPPNSLGYRVDEQMSSVRRYEIVRDELRRAAEIVEPGEAGAPVFGDAPTTVQIVNEVVDRAEMHRPTFMGDVIGEPFPRVEPS